MEKNILKRHDNPLNMKSSQTRCLQADFSATIIWRITVAGTGEKYKSYICI